MRALASMAAALSLASQLALSTALGLAPKRVELAPPRGHDNEKYVLGVTNKAGVTRYNRKRATAMRSGGMAWWPDAAERTSKFAGASDLSDNVSWGWHHPNGVYATIPVGSPLIDASSNIYLATDDAVRKFTIEGDLVWSYAPRGQIASAPSLMQAAPARRALRKLRRPPGSELLSEDFEAAMADQLGPARPGGAEEPEDKLDQEDLEAADAKEAEDELEPEWAKVKADSVPYVSLFSDVRAGDHIRVRPGARFRDGKDHYRAGEKAEVVNVVSQAGEKKAVIHWLRTGRASTTAVDSMNQTFKRVTSVGATILVGSTTSGYVFAIDVDTGDEVWATQASDQISGVKGATSGYDGVVFVATNRCVDRYCYRYRSVTNPLTPGNAYIRALSATDGTLIWDFRPKSPLWNFVPQFSQSGDAVIFNDYEGAVYSLDIETGALKWRTEGAMGTHTQASCVYSGQTNQVFALGVVHYEGEFCNPYIPRGIQPPCGTWNDWPGWVRALNASTGRMQWETSLPQPPASAAFGFLNTPRFHTRLVVSMGFNCHYGAKSELWTLSPDTGHPRVKMDGPTLWTPQCAGDREAGDVRRAQTGRAYCEPGSWSTPVIDGNGDVYIGNQVGELQRLGADSESATGSKDFKLLSTLTTDVAFQDQAIALAPNIMAVATCTSLIVFNAYLDNASFGFNGTWEFMPGRENYPAWEVES